MKLIQNQDYIVMSVALKVRELIMKLESIKNNIKKKYEEASN